MSNSQDRAYIFKHPIARAIHPAINTARNTYISNVQSKMAAAFMTAINNRAAAYKSQAELEQVATDLIIIAAVAGGIAFLPIGASGAAAGNWLARGYAAKVLVAGGKKLPIKTLRALAQTRASKIVKFGFQGISHDHSVFVGSFTKAGSNTTTALAGYAVKKFRDFAKSSFSASSNNSEISALVLKPEYYGANLLSYINSMFNKWLHYLEVLDKDPNMTDKMWEDLREDLLVSPVLKKPAAPDTDLLEYKFELLFYLYDMISKTTYLKFSDQKYQAFLDCVRHSPRECNASNVYDRVPIPSPSTGDTKGSVQKFPTHGLDYFDPGTKVGARINKAYNYVFENDVNFRYYLSQQEICFEGGNFFKNRLILNDVDRNLLRKAEICLEALALGTSPQEVGGAPLLKAG